jgi:hypothetical protein
MLFNAAVVLSQTGVYEPFSINEMKSNSAESELSKLVNGAKIVDVNFNVINQILESRSGSINIKLPFNGANMQVKLHKFDILKEDAKLVAGTLNGDVLMNRKNEFVAYTSDLKDKYSPLVVVTFFKDDVTALVISNSETYVLAKQKNSNDFISYQSSKLKIHNEFNCRADELGIPDRITEIQKNLSGNMNSMQTNTLYKANIAVESDFEFYTYWGNSVERATNYIISLYVPVSAIYSRDVNVQLQLGYIRVWATAGDPYPESNSSGTLLNTFRNYWNQNMQSTQRTLAHFISTRPGGLGGIAWVDVLCASGPGSYGYAFSDIDASFNPLPTYSWDVMVIAHETGHNFGSPHTHSCSWPGGPIDSCYATEGGCYSGPPIARVGTIMSYCHLNGSIALFFGTLPSELIRNRSENAACLNIIPGYSVAYPNGGNFYRSGTTVPVIWGASNTGNVDLQYTTNNGTNWNNLATNIDATLRTYPWIIPYSPTTIQAKVRVFQSGNVSTADESDSTFQLRPTISPFNLLEPPQMFRTYVAAGDTSKLHFTFRKAGTLPEFKYKWTLSTTNNSSSYPLFSNNSGADSICSVSRNVLDSLASSWGAGNVGDSLRLRWTVKCFTQFDSLASSANNLITLVRGVIGIEPISSAIPDRFFVNPNYPNPFNPETRIKFGLPSNADVKISIYDLLGRQVEVLINSRLDAGEYLANWNATNFASGIYIYKIEARDVKGNNFIETRRMVLVK